MYRNLRTNLPREVMSYTDFPFTRAWLDARRFCSHEEVCSGSHILPACMWGFNAFGAGPAEFHSHCNMANSLLTPKPIRMRDEGLLLPTITPSRHAI